MLLALKIIKLFINSLICESIVSGIMHRVSNPNCGAQFAWAGDVKRFTNIIGHQDPPQYSVYCKTDIWPLWYLWFIYFKVGPNLKYSVCNFFFRFPYKVALYVIVYTLIV